MMLFSRRTILILSIALVACWTSQAHSVDHPVTAIMSRATAEYDDADILLEEAYEDSNHEEGLDHEDDHDDEDEDQDEDHDSHDEDYDATLLLEASESLEDKPWSEVIIASLFINLATLAGLAFLTGELLIKAFCKKSDSDAKQESSWKFTQNIVPSFACGALLATCAFLILPESIAMITSHVAGEGAHAGHRFLEEEEEEDLEVPVAWRFGMSLLGGFLLPAVTGLFFPHYHELELGDACMEAKNKEVIEQNNIELETASALALQEVIEVKEEGSEKDDDSADDPMTLDEGCESAGCDHGEHHCHDETEQDLTVAYESKPLARSTNINYSLAASVLLGDFFHNFTDGVLVGTAFSLCDRQLAIAITLATVYHELAQEVADFFLLTKQCNIRPGMALLLNFVGGLSVLFGALFILIIDTSSNATGCILAIGAGVYIYVAVGECLPRAQQVQTNATDKVISLVSFVVGAIPIGLVLLNHGHCGGH
jgi:zinc transporter ZupT